jgi:GNAT superfamily N-acetyltransferase
MRAKEGNRVLEHLDYLESLARTVEENWCAAWASLGAVNASPRTIVEDTPGYLRVYTPSMSETLMNMIIRYRAPGPVRRAEVEAMLQPYRQHSLPTQWWLMVGMEPAGLRAQLTAIGMQSWGGAAAMVLDLAHWEPRYLAPPDGTTLGRIASADDAAAALAIICEVFYVPEVAMARWTTSNPAFEIYLARLRGRPATALGILRDGPVVGVYHVATAPWARRQGLAGNLLLLALREARTAGATLSTLTATPEARTLYETLGYRAVGIMEQWMLGPQPALELHHGWQG